MTGIQDAVDALKAERERLDSAIRVLEAVADGGAGVRGFGGGARRRGRPPGRPRKAGRPARSAVARGNGAKAPRGLLKAKVHQVLQGAGKPLGPSALRDAVMRAGYPSKNPKTLYTQIFALAKTDPQLKKTADGFSLKGPRGGRSAAGAKAS